ncbi:hypothetical protein [Rubrolithibacter danxiaensis]|uniref:hypothetical protein n=1 Tax=Rubrolithibacter danxiaensis TaxID=3390805 RepID=UPI003BF8C63B
MKKTSKPVLQEPLHDYEKAEMDLLKAALKRTHTERFEMMTKLMKMNAFFRKAVITHKPFPSDK